MRCCPVRSFSTITRDAIMHTKELSFSLKPGQLRQRYASGQLLPSACIEQVLGRIEAAGRPEVWISRVDAGSLLAQALALASLLQQEGSAVLERMPLFGVPFAIKDNIDAA